MINCMIIKKNDTLSLMAQNALLHRLIKVVSDNALPASISDTRWGNIPTT